MSLEFLKEKCIYKEGKLFWSVRNGRVNKGDEVGYQRPNGYRIMTIKGQYMYVHRAIFLLHHGYLPECIDHIDGNPFNNDINNLRESTKAENNCNRSAGHANKSGHKNIHFRAGKWRVQITSDGKTKSFGDYFDINVAKFVADSMRYALHGKFARA